MTSRLKFLILREKAALGGQTDPILHPDWDTLGLLVDKMLT